MHAYQITAHQACTLGLVTEVFPDASLKEEVWPRLQSYAKLPVKSLVYSKALTRDVEKDILHKVHTIKETNAITVVLKNLVL